MVSKVLVTGGAGFIGTHLCRALVDKGHNVTSLDLKTPQTPIPGVDYRQGDVLDPAMLSAAVRGQHCVFHFAALVSVPLCQQEPEKSYQTNVISTLRVLEEIKKGGSPVRVVFASSSAVYGSHHEKGQPCRENELPSPTSLYGAQKLASEHAVRVYHDMCAIPAVVFRFFNVYGPGQDPHSPYSGVVSLFAKAVKTEDALYLNGGGSQTRDFIFVSDIVGACLSAMDLADHQCDASPINLGTGHGVSIKELAETMAAVSRAGSAIKNAPPRNGDILHSLAESVRARNTLNWKPSVTLGDGLSQLLLQ